MTEFTVHFNNKNVEALRQEICDTISHGSRTDIDLNSMDVAVLSTRLMHHVEDKLFELRLHGFDLELEREALSRLEEILFGDVVGRSTDDLEMRATEAIHAFLGESNGK